MPLGHHKATQGVHHGGVSGMSSPTGSEGKEEFFHDDSDDEIGDEGELPLDIVAADLIYPDAFILALQRRGLLTDTDETSTGFEVKGRMSRRTTGNESGQNSLQQKNKGKSKGKKTTESPRFGGLAALAAVTVWLPWGCDIGLPIMMSERHGAEVIADELWGTMDVYTLVMGPTQ